MTNWYPRAIEILAKIEDPKAVLFRIAAKHPKAIVDACPDVVTVAEHVERCRNLMLAGEKITAIKLWREATGDSLKDSKDACEALI